MSRVLHLPSFTIANCSPPAFPHGKYGDFVGKLTPEGPLLCGGNINWVKQKACYLLTWSGNWEEVQGMNMKRKGAAAVEIDGGWWVTGKVCTFGPYRVKSLKTSLILKNPAPLERNLRTFEQQLMIKRAYLH